MSSGAANFPVPVMSRLVKVRSAILKDAATPVFRN
jgi:hypothetical protein